MSVRCAGWDEMSTVPAAARGWFGTFGDTSGLANDAGGAPTAGFFIVGAEGPGAAWAPASEAGPDGAWLPSCSPKTKASGW